MFKGVIDTVTQHLVSYSTVLIHSVVSDFVTPWTVVR